MFTYNPHSEHSSNFAHLPLLCSQVQQVATPLCRTYELVIYILQLMMTTKIKNEIRIYFESQIQLLDLPGFVYVF